MSGCLARTFQVFPILHGMSERMLYIPEYIYLDPRMRPSLQHVNSGVFSFLRRRLEDLTLTQEVHNARTKTQFRRAVTRFRNSSYQPDMGEDGLLFARLRSALADTLLSCER